MRNPTRLDARDDRRHPASIPYCGERLSMRRYLLFATELYALPILRPLQAAIRAAGDEVAWFLPPALGGWLRDEECRIVTMHEARAWQPLAVFAASNWVPPGLAGVKVQVFHGFNVEKRSDSRGHFRIRGLFDLYCTQGPATTKPFVELARQHGHFAVVETGWPKLDPLFLPDAESGADLRTRDGRTVVMYASTFTESLSSAPALYEEIARQIACGERYWLLTLHPKAPSELVERYRALAGGNARFIDSTELVDAMRAADVLVCDTSSVVSEFVVQRKPVVTLRNRAPKPHMIDIQTPEQLEEALAQALTPSEALRLAIHTYADAIHPTRDGRASERVLAATTDLVAGRLGRLGHKPLNLWRRLQIRRQLKAFARTHD